MEFNCQQDALSVLQKLADRRCRSVLISGTTGSGKSWLGKQYATMLGISDYAKVEPTVAAIRDIQDMCSNLTTPLVVIIENLDLGVAGAAYTLLKFLEEPQDNIYIVVTVRNLYMIPDTIVSRCQVVWTSEPRNSDIVEFAQKHDSYKYDRIKDTVPFLACASFSDVLQVYDMSSQQLDYLSKLPEVLQAPENVSNIVWKLGHYADNSATPLEFVIRILIKQLDDARVFAIGRKCLQDLSASRIAAHAVLAKFVMDCRYGQR